MKPEAVVFDLDATLCHYTISVVEVIERALQRVGLPSDRFGPVEQLADAYNRAWWSSEETLRLPTDELRCRAWVSISKDRDVDETTAVRVSDAYSAIRRETGIRLYEGVPSLLADLRRDHQIGILTNGPSDMQWEKLRNLDLPPAVDAIVVAGDLGIFKPDPRPFRQVLATLGTSPAAAVFVGDSYEHDMVGAHGVGMRTVWIRTNGVNPRESSAADHTIGHVGELRELLL
ncbi:MAG: HAD family hydrolase [Candidatus Bipolaricaulia bacterium]